MCCIYFYPTTEFIEPKKRGERAVHPLTPGASVVQFDEISKQRIIKAFATIPNTTTRRTKNQFMEIKNKLGRVPSLIEFDQGGNVSGRVFLDLKNSFGSYYEFLLNTRDEQEILSKEQGIRLNIYRIVLVADLEFMRHCF